MPGISIPQKDTQAAADKAAIRPPTWWGAQKRAIKAHKHSYVLLAPYMILFGVFTVLPVVMSILISFTYFNMLEFPRFIGWQNYARLFLNDDVFLIAVKNTILLAVITGPISYLACFLFAWIINDLRPKLRAFMTLIFYAPSISGNVYFLWQLIFSGDRYGIANGFLIKLGIILEPILWLKTEQYILPIIIL
ncbi:MAG TPA: sugar ABC transporter permease, partial [Bacilli bacterium]